MSNEFIRLSVVGNNVTDRAMLSVGDNVIATQKFSLEFEQCSCSVPYALSNNALFLYDQVANIRHRECLELKPQARGVCAGFSGTPKSTVQLKKF